MPCESEKTTLGTSVFGLLGNVGVIVYKGGKNALTVANPFNFIGALLRELAAFENLKRCAELQGIDVDALRRERDELQREVEELNRVLEHQHAAAP